MTGTVYTCLHTNQSRSYLYHSVFYENPSNGSRIVPCWRKDRQKNRQTDRQVERHDEAKIAVLRTSP